MDLLNEFTQLVASLEDRGVDYATCGGLAMAVHGYVRATKDIDLLVREVDLEKAFSIAKSLGYDIEVLPLEFAGGRFKLRRLSKIDQETKVSITVDFILVTDHLNDVWQDRELVEWESRRAWVVSRRGLIKMKLSAGRDQDLVDIKNLEATDDDQLQCGHVADRYRPKVGRSEPAVASLRHFKQSTPSETNS